MPGHTAAAHACSNMLVAARLASSVLFSCSSSPMTALLPALSAGWRACATARELDERHEAGDRALL